MITQVRPPEGDDPGHENVVRMTLEDVESQHERTGLVQDPYATAELARRHERTESMIRKAHEQFL